MLISINDLATIPEICYLVLIPEANDQLVQGRVEKVEQHNYEKDNLIVNLQIDSESFLIYLLYLFKRATVIDPVPPFREASDLHQPSLLVLYDSPPSSFVMSASVAAVYMVLKPVYTAICSVTE
jgi:hypothetical protein